MVDVEKKYPALAVKIARWFSKDGDYLVYYNRKGEAIPCTRDEQDAWIAEGYRIIDGHMRNLGRHGWLWAIGSVAVIHLMMSEWLPLILMVPIVVAFWASFAIYATRDTQRYFLTLRELRNRIEDKVRWRDPVAAKPRRQNSFHRIGMFAGLAFFGYFGLTVLSGSKPSWVGLGLAALFYVTYLVAAALIAPLDKAHVRQTGKWYRRR
jgi:hypothetical protein